MTDTKRRTVTGALAAALATIALAGCPGGGSSPPSPPPAAPPPAAPAAPAPPAPSGAASVSGFGTIKGRVLVTRAVTPPAKVTVTQDAEVCGNPYDPGSLKLGEGGALDQCVVYLKGPAAPADWKKAGTYVMDQKACHYTPRILVVPVGETVTFTSSDPMLHNVKSPYKSFNQGVSKDSSQKLVCDTPDFAELACSIHPFMAGLLVVAENPWYAITDAAGAFRLERVPAGTWKIIARHEVLKKHSKEGSSVTVEPDKETAIDLKFE